MTKIWHGTQGNDALVGSTTEQNEFFDVGIGQDFAIGGQRNDMFHMLVDQKIDKVDGGAGEDTIDYSGADRAVNVNLATGVVTAAFNVAGFPFAVVDQVAAVKNVEDVVGSRFNDTITGSAGNNRLDGGAGDDKIHGGDGNDTLIGGTGHNLLDGGTGSDTADYSSAQHWVLADLATGTGVQLDSSFNAVAQDTYVSIENLTGSSQADILIGDANANVINGGGGNDVVQGGGGGDTLHGGAGDDQLIGDNFLAATASSTTQMFGDDGNDTLFGSAGKDIMDGGTGNDWADYSQQDFDPVLGWQANVGHDHSGVTVDLSTGTGHGGYAEGDTYVNIENVRGTDGDDTITGDANDNILVGLAGNNVIHGGDGNDTLMGNGQLFGDAGNDTLIASSSGTTHYDGGDGVDTVDYRNSEYGAVVALTPVLLPSGSFDASGHQIGHDSYTSIENVEGSQGNDIVVGTADANVIDGNGGNDVLFSLDGNDTVNGGDGDDRIEGGAGADTLDGGSGVNTVSYSLSTQGVIVNLATSTATGGDATGDVISNFQNVAGSHGNDTLIGSSGNNVLFEEAGNNVLVGGGGQDTFGFASFLTGSNFVADFHVGEDKIAIVGSDSMQDLHVTQTATGTLITFDNTSGSIMLAGVNAQNFVQHESTEIVFSQTLDTLLHG